MSQSSLLRSLPPTLRRAAQQPTYWATLFSVGIHGLLWVTLPMVPSNSAELEEPDLRRTVPLVELSPDQVSRLPDLSEPSSSPDFSASALDEYDLSQYLEEPYDTDSFETEDYSDYSYDDYSSIIPTPNIPPSLTWEDYIEPYPNETYTDPYPQQEELYIQPDLQPDVAPEVEPEPQAEAPPVIEEFEYDDFGEAPQTLPELDELAVVPSNIDESDTPPTSDEIETTPEVPPSDENTSEPEPIDPLIAEQQALREQLTYNEEGTSRADADLAFLDHYYINQGQADVDAIRDEQRFRLNAPFPRAACSLQQTIDAYFGLRIDEAGNVVEEDLQLMRSSGYPLFNDAGREFLLEEDLSEFFVEDHNLYLVNVMFEFDETRCPVIFTPNDSEEGQG